MKRRSQFVYQNKNVPRGTHKRRNPKNVPRGTNKKA